MPEPKLKDLIDKYEVSSTLLDVSTRLVSHVTAIEAIAKDPTLANARRVTDTLQDLVNAWESHLQVSDPEAWERAKVELAQLEAAGGLKT